MKNIMTNASCVALVLSALAVTSTKAQSLDNDSAASSGFYVGYGIVERSVESNFGDLDGDGSSIIFGYRHDKNLSYELEIQDIDYDDLVVDDIRVHDTTGEFTYFSIIWSGQYGAVEPYARIIFGDSDVSARATQGDLTTSETVSDSGEAFGVGLNYAFTENFVVRADFTVQSEHQDVLTIAPIWRF